MKRVIPLLFLALTSCATSPKYNSTPKVYFPSLPQNVVAAGTTVKIPTKDLNNQEAERLFVEVINSEHKNARAVQSAKAFYAKLKRIYNSSAKN